MSDQEAIERVRPQERARRSFRELVRAVAAGESLDSALAAAHEQNPEHVPTNLSEYQRFTLLHMAAVQAKQ